MASIVAHLVMRHQINVVGGDYSEAPTWIKLLHATFLPHFYMFMLGVFLHRHYHLLAKFLTGSFWKWAVLWVGITLLGEFYLGGETILGTFSYLLARFILAAVTISFAYTKPGLSNKLLHGTDISYGTYLFHFLIINTLIEVGFLSHPLFVPVVFVSALLVGYLSWHLIEKPAMRFKNRKPKDPSFVAKKAS